MKDIYEKLGLFYLGKNSDETLNLYKSKDLTTHAMLVGMTGSGKTGLGISLIEEAAIDNIPSIVIDPKGDMGNLCLAFKDLSAEEFTPWSEKPEESAKLWQNGLLASSQDRERVAKYANVEKTIYTPGSSAGVSVNILSSFEAPSQELLEDTDTFTSLINTSVGSLLSLISLESSNPNAKEHLLLSNILYHFWTKGISLTLEDIIGYVASPPFKKIGILSLSTFYKQADRMKLAIAINGVISSVTFSSWLKGERLNIQDMLYDDAGKAKVAIFSIAHLNDAQRMFFVTLLLNSYINWMRKQRGASRLKSILYMDEIYGFFPPVKNPPSKEPMMLLLKQARAFGTGIILSTQNPSDIDYKGASNIGTWFVGKLQTSQDIEKIVNGMSLDSSDAKRFISQKIASLQGRHFLVKNIHNNALVEFSTRWVLSFLKGPLTKNDIKHLMQDKKETHKFEPPKIEKIEQKAATREPLSKEIKEYFLDSNINTKEPYQAFLYVDAKVRFYNQKRFIDKQERLYIALPLEHDVLEYRYKESLLQERPLLQNTPFQNAEFATLPTEIKESKNLNSFAKKIEQSIYTTERLELFVCKRLRLESTLGETQKEFTLRVQEELQERKEEKVEKLTERFKKRFTRLEDRQERLHAKLQKEENDVSSKTTDTFVEIGLTLLGAFFGRKKLSTSTIRKGSSAFKKGRGVYKEKDDVKRVESQISKLQEDIEELNLEFEEKVYELDEEFSIKNYEIKNFFITPRRSDIEILDMAILWQR